MIKKICRNCRFLKEMTGPYDTDNYYFCDSGNLCLTVNPDEECANFPWSFKPRNELLLKYWEKNNNQIPHQNI